MADPRETVRDVMEKAYFHEHTAEHNLVVSLNLPYTMIAAGIGVSVFLVRELPTHPDGAFWWMSAVFLTLALLILVYAGYHVIGAALGHGRANVAYIDINDMRHYFDNLYSYYTNQGDDDPDAKALADFQDALIAEYGAAATYNMKANFVRKQRRSRALAALFGVGACLFISAIALIVEEFRENADGGERNGQPQAEQASGRSPGTIAGQSWAMRR